MPKMLKVTRQSTLDTLGLPRPPVNEQQRMLFLSANEIADLTGYKQPSKQIAWLRQYGIRVFVSRVGHPRILRSDLESKDGEPRTKPDLDALRQLR